MEILNTVAFVGFGSISLIIFILGYKLLRSDSELYNNNRSHNKSFTAALKGIVCEPQEDSRDFRCAAGMAYNKKSGEIIFQGKLSHEAIQDVIR